MKFFLDTNVWLSATIFSGLCEEIVLQCAQRGALFSSDLVRAEAHEVLLRKFPNQANACSLFDASWQVAQLVADVDEPRDDNDRRLVMGALSGKADVFVTGDKRVLGWKRMERGAASIRIVSVREAWHLLAPVGG